jgi:hypothetical protein
VSSTPLIAAPLYGLRTWRLVADADGERLTAVHRGTPWPAGGAWLDAVCHGDVSHDPPQSGCVCGVHAWHPRPASARLVLASRVEVPGVVEATGAIEVHHEGFRAARGRPHALFLLPGRNESLLRRLGERHGVPVIPVEGPADVLAWCQARGLGLDREVVDDLIGDADERRRARRRKRRADALRVACAVAVSGGLLFAGLQYADDADGPQERFGRTGKFVAR